MDADIWQVTFESAFAFSIVTLALLVVFQKMWEDAKRPALAREFAGFFRVDFGDWKFLLLAVAVGFFPVALNFLGAKFTPLVFSPQEAAIKVFFAPVYEEVIFRGLLFATIFIFAKIALKKEGSGVAIFAVTFSAILFGLFHENPNGASFLLRLANGAFNAGLYLASKKNLASPMIAHAVNNLFILYLLI